MNNMFNSYEPLPCKHCGKDTLKNPSMSIVVLYENDEDVFDTIYVCCKGECDRNLGKLPGWKDLSEFTNPILYIQHINAILNSIQKNEVTIFTNEALQEYKNILLKTAPFVFRDMKDGEIQAAIDSNMSPF